LENKLTDLQKAVLLRDRQFWRPSKIAAEMGLTLQRVDNVRRRLRELGFDVQVWKVRRTKKQLAEARAAKEPVPIAAPKREACPQCGNVYSCAI